jgi:acetyltransferase-like isoleucine patch superfamily enzyme
MNLVKKFINRIKVELISVYLRFKYRKHKCIIKSQVKINSQTILESRIFIKKGCNINNSYIGYGTYLSKYCDFHNCHIGRFCSIAPHSEVVTGLHPTKNFVSTHPSFFSIMKQSGFTFVNKNLFDEHKYADNDRKISVIIGNDVWIGYGVKILEGISIGDGAVIGAGALVTKDVEPYSIVGGVPAKIIKKRHNQKQIDFLIDFKWWDKDFEWIQKNSCLFNDIEKFIKENSSGKFS